MTWQISGKDADTLIKAAEAVNFWSDNVTTTPKVYDEIYANKMSYPEQLYTRIGVIDNSNLGL